MSITVGSGVEPAPGGEASQTSIGPPGPGTWTRRISGCRTPRCQAEPIRVRVRSRPFPAVITSGARCSRVPTTTTRRPSGETARCSQAASAWASGRGSAVVAAARPVAGSSSNRQGTQRARSDTSAIRAALPAQNGPPREVTCQPSRSVSSCQPIGRSSSGASAWGWPEPSAGAITIPGLTSSWAPASITPTTASQRPSGETAGWLAGPPRARISTGGASSSPTRQIVGLG